MRTAASRQRMGHLKRVGYCVCLGVIVTALISVFDPEGVCVLARPGLISTVLVAGLTFNDDFVLLIPWQVGSVFFYAIPFYGISWAYTGLREEREEAKAQAHDVVRPAS